MMKLYFKAMFKRRGSSLLVCTLFLAILAATPSLAQAPPNDDICNAIALTAGGAADCQNTTNATTGANDPNIASCSGLNNTVWYTFTPTVSGMYPINMTTPATGDPLWSWIFMYEVSGGCATPTYTYVPFSTTTATPGCFQGTSSANNQNNIFNTGPLTAGTTYYIFIDGNSGDVGSYCLSILPVITCSAITGLTAGAVTSTDVSFSWTPSISNPGLGYEFYHSATNTAPTSASTATGSVAAGVTTGTINGLTPGTTYYIWVRAACSAADVSTWVGPITMVTACLPVTTFPWTEGFESLSTVGAFPNCWFEENGDWVTSNATTYNTPFAGSNYLRNSWAATNEHMWTPGFDLVAGTSYDFSFMVQGDGFTGWTVDVLQNTTPSSTGAAQVGTTFTVPGSGPIAIQPYTKQTYTFVPSTSGVYYFALKVNQPSGTPWYVAFDEFKMDVTPSCSEPTSLAVGASTTTDITLNWTASVSNPAFGYEYYHDVTNTAPTAASTPTGSVGVGVNTATISGLSPQTTYYVWLRSVCSPADMSTWAGPISVMTECLPVSTLPWNETFETTSTTKSCWKVVNDNGDADLWNLSYATNPHGGALTAMMYTDGNGGANDDWLITPAITLTGAQWLKYWYRVQSTGEPNDYEILLSTTGTAPADFTTTVLPLTSVSNTTYAENTVNLSAFSGTVYLAFRVPPGGLDGWRLYIDDVLIENIPSCQVPTALTPVSSTTTDVSFGWTASATNPAFGYEYYHDISNTAPTAASTPTGSVGVGVTAATISGLSAQTTYYVWVRGVCAPSDQSSWAGPIAITTQCVVFPAPFVESFNTNTTPQCWSNTGAEAWMFNNTQPGYGPASEHTGNSGYFAWVDDSSPNNIGTTLTSPIIDISTLTNPRVRFFIYSNNTNTPSGVQNDTLIVEAFNGSSWIHIDSITQNLGPQWTELSYSLAALGSSTVQLRFIVNENAVNNFYHDISIDDIYVESTPTCLPPTVLTPGTATTSSISFSWTASASNPGLGYEYYHSTSSTVPTAGTSPTGTAPSATNATISGLPSGTPYFVWVRANCGGNDLSTWSSAITISTLITNDEASTAIPLTVNPDYDCGATTPGTTLGATTSADAAPSCNPTGINDDVWYSFTATNTDHRITLYGVTAVSNIALYSGTPGSLTQVTGSCATNNNTTTAANIYATGLTVSSVYYVRVYTQTATASTNSPFTICIGTAPSAAPVNDLCANAINIGNSLPMTGSNGGATEEVAACNGAAVANEVWFTFTTGSVAGNVTVTGITTYADIVMEAFTGICGSLTSASTCIDVPAIGTESLVIAAQANTTYYVRVYGFTVPSGPDQGTFTIHALGTPLAVKLTDITATNVGKRNRVDWITASETAGDRFELERSADGRSFSQLSTINARGEASTYSYWDEKPVAGVNYYRLKMVDAAGSFTYSDVVTARVAGSGAFTVEAYPNPVSEMLTVKVYGTAGNNPIVSVSDVTGKVVKVVDVVNNEATINMSGLAQGMYLVKYTDHNHTETLKVNKK